MEIPGQSQVSAVSEQGSGLKAGGSSGALVSKAKEIGLCVALGGVLALVFLFTFPAAALSTLMHAVLHLPGPGAGIALIMGPFLLLAVLGASLVSQTRGLALAAALGFALSCSVVVSLLAIPTNPKGAIGSPLFIGAIAVSGLAVEVVMRLGKRTSETVRFLLAGATANLGLLLFYWLAIFPRTAEWIQWRDVPLLTALCLAAGLLFGYLARLLWKPLLGALSVECKE